MRRSSYIQKFLRFSLLAVLAQFPAWAEPFRVTKTHLVQLAASADAEQTQVTVTAGINDCIAVRLPDSMTFVQGIEFNIKIPQEVSVWRDSVAYSLYDDVSPQPEPERIDYEGTRVYVGTFPERLNYIVQVPLTGQNSIKESPYAKKIPVVPDSSKNVIFFRMQLAMKGVDDSVYASRFDVTVKPIFRAIGRLHISVSDPASKKDPAGQYTVFADEKRQDSGNTLLLKSGMHHISLVSDSYRNEVRSVTVEQAKDSYLRIELRDIKPTLLVTAPEAAQVFFDGEPLQGAGRSFVIVPGEHVLRCVISDYETVKTFTAANGRSYNIAFTVDAVLSESD